MWIIYDKSTDDIVGLNGDGAGEMSKEDALEEVVNGLVKKKEMSAYDAFPITDTKEIESLTATPFQQVKVKKSRGKITGFFMESRQAQLIAESDAPDVHVLDGIGEIPANGTSFCTITVRKTSMEGESLSSAKDNDIVYLRSDGGSIKDVNDNQIRQISLKNGTASFRLYSETNRRVITVSIMTQDNDVLDTRIAIECV